MRDLTVCITNFERGDYLERATRSCHAAGIKNVQVFTMGCKRLDATGSDWCFLPVDLGCHELWLQAAYRSRTNRVIILHDDDMLAPEFGGAYEGIIKPALDNGDAGFASWRGHCRTDDGNIRAVEYHNGQTGIYSSEVLRVLLMRRGRLSLSPVVSVFNRQTLIHALKESERSLPYLHPGMPLGTEIVAYLRHCDAFKSWLYVNRVLSYYGSHEGSGTVKAEKSGDISALTTGYDQARLFCAQNNRPKQYPPRLLLTYWPGLNNERITNARRTWQFQFNLGDMLDFPYASEKTPSIHEILDHAASMAMPEDVLVYANLDLAFTIDLPQRILACIRQSHGVCVAWRRTMDYNPEQHFKSVRQGSKDGGVDLIAVTVDWWKKHRQYIPNVFISSTYWDYVFRVYCERATGDKCYIDDGTYHAPHESLFAKLRLTTPEQKHNHEQARKFFASIGRHGIVRQLEHDAI